MTRATITPLLPRSVHARKRPAAIVFVFLAEAAWALLVATPVHAWARRAWGGHPDGDAVLFIPGARDLMVWLGQDDAALPVTVRTAIVLLAVGAVLMQLPLGALVASLAFGRVVPPPADESDASGDSNASDAPGENAPRENAPPPAIRSLRLRGALQIGVSAFLPLAVLLVIGSVTSLLVLGIGSIAAGALDSAFTDSLGDARSFTVRVIVIGIFAAFAAVIGIVIDLARAAAVRESGLAAIDGTASPAWNVMLRALRIGLKTSRFHLGAATLGWAARAVVGVALIAIGYVAADMLGGQGGLSLALLFAIHQAVALGRVALRASWMARAVALVAPVQDPR
jgi:hypothetical protein